MSSLNAPLPVLAQLQEASQQVQNPIHDPVLKIAWYRDMLYLVIRASGAPPSTDLHHLHRKSPPYVTEAIGMRASLEATGAFPDLEQHNPRTAFRDFEAAARGGYPAACFRLGMDYEHLNDHIHARECFERGIQRISSSGPYKLQYKLGHAYECTEPPLPLDPLLSVQCYSLASQQGEVEADIGLSKWFSCGSGGAAAAAGRMEGAGGGFEKDEGLGLTFAEKPNCTATPTPRLAFAFKSFHSPLRSNSRQEHDAITETQLILRRTQAAQRAKIQPFSAFPRRFRFHWEKIQWILEPVFVGLANALEEMNMSESLCFQFYHDVNHCGCLGNVNREEGKRGLLIVNGKAV
ncbi:hypothetical protein BDN70DRAFT_900167 [Pholiota conissans]|uniref:Uncharacterized protein n=1 Tax=Pholiota conissans TaxID=109636 RepID=A0A9P6CTD5_9AGAR|nr:hypothetical protein BDN70DRAFT_900167 [Pholiota conissans]